MDKLQQLQSQLKDAMHSRKLHAPTKGNLGSQWNYWNNKVHILIIKIEKLKFLKEKERLCLWKVTRPYCNPNIVYIYSTSKKRAENRSNGTYGFAQDTKAEKVNPENNKIVCEIKMGNAITR